MNPVRQPTAAAAACTLEKFLHTQQLQLTLHQHQSRTSQTTGTNEHNQNAPVPINPMCTISNQYPFKPILQIQTAAASASTTTPTIIDPSSVLSIPLNVRVDLNDPQNRVAHTPDATILTLRIKQDLSTESDSSTNEDDFPTARELSPSEYPPLYCRSCGTTIFASNQRPFRVFPLPTPYWTELTELWFCHTENNAHMDKLAGAKIEVEPGKILVDKLLIKVDRRDLNPQLADAWRRHPSVSKIMEQFKSSQTGPSIDSTAAMTDVETVSSSTPLSSHDIWSPLPCASESCQTIIGSILLTVQPSLDPREAIRPSTVSHEVRLFKYQLSNCFRKKSDHITNGTEESKESNIAITTAAPSSQIFVSPSNDPLVRIPFCSCASYALSPLLTCSNVYLYYSFENFMTEDLLQRYHKQPIGKFIIENTLDESATGTSATETKVFIRLFVTQWHLPLASNQIDIFPYTPQFHDSNHMVSVIKLEYGVHSDENESTLQTFIYGKTIKKNRSQANHSTATPHPPTKHSDSCTHLSHDHDMKSDSDAGVSSNSNTASAATNSSFSHANPFPTNIERLNYTTQECQTLIRILSTRSHLWPQSLRSGIRDPTMTTSCLVKLSKNLKP